jgi:transposase
MECLVKQDPNDPRALLSLIHSQAERIEELEQQLAWFKRQIFGQKSERVTGAPGQSELFTATTGEAPPAPPAATETITYERRRPKRGPLPRDLPRERIELDVEATDKVCPCCHGERRRIGEERTEELRFAPARFWVREYVRPKYACPRCEEGGVVIAAAPRRLIPKSLFGPDVLAHLLLSKYEDHLPLHRQLKIFARHGVTLCESTVNQAVLACAERLSPLVDLLKAQILTSGRIFTDDTPIILKGNRPGERLQARLWVYIGRGETAPPGSVFEFTTDRRGERPYRFLEGFQGYLQADAYSGYDALYASALVVEVACWDHARRYFEKAAKLHKKSGRAHVALTYIRALYRLERTIKDESPEERFWARRREALPILRQFKDWLEQQAASVSTKSLFGAALTYTINQWQALVEYTNHGMLEISNATAENAIRPVALSRKNWLFVGSERGGHTAAVLFSLLATCRQNGVNPWHWLAHVLEHLPASAEADYPSLLPFHFTERFPL